MVYYYLLVLNIDQDPLNQDKQLIDTNIWS